MPEPEYRTLTVEQAVAILTAAKFSEFTGVLRGDD